MAPSTELYGEDRRAHTRLILKAFGFEHFCMLRPCTGDPSCKARLIDISRGGARCRMENGTVLAIGNAVTLDSELAHKGYSLTGVTAVIRWVGDNYVGLQFEQELPIGIAELQQMLTP